MTNKANKKKFAHRIALTIAREYEAGCAVSVTATSIVLLPMHVSELTRKAMSQLCAVCLPFLKAGECN